MTAHDWLLIILYILKIISKGEDKSDAVRQAAAKFGVFESEIWAHGGF